MALTHNVDTACLCLHHTALRVPRGHRAPLLAHKMPCHPERSEGSIFVAFRLCPERSVSAVKESCLVGSLSFVIPCVDRESMPFGFLRAVWREKGERREFPAYAGNDVLWGHVRAALPSLRSGERQKAERQKARRWILRVAQDDKGPWGQAR